MLPASRVEQIARTAASMRAMTSTVQRVLAEPSTDSEGKDALRITFVLSDRGAKELTGDQALDILVELKHNLEQAGEERFAIIEYATEKELAESATDVAPFEA
jgi:hypothetical protein